MNTILEQLDALASLAAAATEGPWVQASHRGSNPLQIEQPDQYGAVVAYVEESEDAALDNSAFIAAARNFLTPENIAALRAAAAPVVESRPADAEKVFDEVREVLTYDGNGGRDYDLVKRFDELTAKALAALSAVPTEGAAGQTWIPVAEAEIQVGRQYWIAIVPDMQWIYGAVTTGSLRPAGKGEEQGQWMRGESEDIDADCVTHVMPYVRPAAPLTPQPTPAA